MGRTESLHGHYMGLALRLARRGLGQTSPNPAVGAVIVNRGAIVGRGWHRKAGTPHAEVIAIEAAGALARGAALYVTLEPCGHHGRTPPCTDGIIKAGIKEVHIGAMDPNPLVSGRGVERLREAGLRVNAGILEKECRALNEAYEKYITKKLPFVTLKLGATLDGRTGTAKGESRWITGHASRARVHRFRSIVDAVMVGGATVRKDDPELTVRHARGRNPARVVVTNSFNISAKANVFKGLKHGERLVIFAPSGVCDARAASLTKAGAEVIRLRKTGHGVSLRQALRELARRAVTSVMIEGGARLAAEALRHGLVDKVVFFYSPRIMGGDGLPMVGDLGLKRLSRAVRLKDVRVTPIGEDFMVEGRIARRGPLKNS